MQTGSERNASDWFTPGRFAILLGCLMFAAFPKIILGQESFFYHDYGVLGYPFLAYHHDAFWQGRIVPLWNPLNNCGAPFMAQWGTMSLYPGSLIYLLFPLPWSVSYFWLLHLFLGGMGMYFLARRWTGVNSAAALAGTIFVFNGVTVSCLQWTNYIVTLGWMPWVVLLSERAWREGGRRVIVAALVVALQLLAGVPEMVIFTWLIIGAMWLADFHKSSAPGPIGNIFYQRTVRIASVAILAAGLTACQILPFLDLLAHSQRDSSFATSKWAMPGWGWANLFVPLFHNFQTPEGTFFQFGQEFFPTYYLGLGVMALAVWGAWRVREARVWALAALTLFALVMALADDGYVYPIVRRLFPPLGVARFQIKFMEIAGFTVPLLAAFGLLWWQSTRGTAARSYRWPVVSWVLIVGITGAVLWEAYHYPFYYDQWDPTCGNAISRVVLASGFLGALWIGTRFERLLKPILVALPLMVFVDLQSHQPMRYPTIPADRFYPGVWSAANNSAPAPKHGEGRVFISPQAEETLLHSTVENFANNFTGKRMAVWSGLNMIDGVPKVNGSSTLQLREEKVIEKQLYNSTTNEYPRMLDFLGVTWMTKPGTVVEWTNRATAMPLATIGKRPIFTDDLTIARGFEGAPNTINMLHWAADDSVNVDLPWEEQKSVTAKLEVEARITSATYAPERIDLKTQSTNSSMVVLAQSFYHPWKAYVDGKATPIWRANYAFQALQVPAGNHSVVVRYEDAAFHLGLRITVVTMLVMVGFWIWKRDPVVEERT